MSDFSSSGVRTGKWGFAVLLGILSVLCLWAIQATLSYRQALFFNVFFLFHPLPLYFVAFSWGKRALGISVLTAMSVSLILFESPLVMNVLLPMFMFNFLLAWVVSDLDLHQSGSDERSPLGNFMAWVAVSAATLWPYVSISYLRLQENWSEKLVDFLGMKEDLIQVQADLIEIQTKITQEGGKNLEMERMERALETMSVILDTVPYYSFPSALVCLWITTHVFCPYVAMLLARYLRTTERPVPVVRHVTIPLAGFGSMVLLSLGAFILFESFPFVKVPVIVSFIFSFGLVGLVRIHDIVRRFPQKTRRRTILALVYVPIVLFMPFVMVFPALLALIDTLLGSRNKDSDRLPCGM